MKHTEIGIIFAFLSASSPDSIASLLFCSCKPCFCKSIYISRDYTVAQDDLAVVNGHGEIVFIKITLLENGLTVFDDLFTLLAGPCNAAIRRMVPAENEDSVFFQIRGYFVEGTLQICCLPDAVDRINAVEIVLRHIEICFHK